MKGEVSMQKYKRSGLRQGERAWFKLLSLKVTRKVAWYRFGDNDKLTGKRPNPRGELTKDAVAGPSGKGFKTEMVDDFRCLEIKLKDPSVKLYLHYKPGVAFFIGINFPAGIVYESVSYETTARALAMHEQGKILWEKVKPIDRRGR
jgi:hypothetical protein